ncbi:MAG: hypothetical protein EZS28_000716 [Streblomastix strix]|uniref:Uncharacterized protein n=1 Tax=Streblomastix strix TaxID=222440 RepID=A0A5J4X9K6_9EUKA|nr:MAG: hypothetical protein EZS28_000716 [Streblomastix strix]
MLILLLATTSVFCKLEIEFYNYTFNGTSFIYDTRSIPIYEQYNKYIVDLDDIVRPFGGSETDNDFSLFPSTYTNESDFAFNEYPTSDELNTNCGAKYAFYNSMVYDFYGAIAHAYFGVDIQPSVLQFINCHPSEMVWLKKYGQEEVEDLYSGCDTHFQSYSIVSGFTSTSCIGVNGYINDACKTECTDGSSIEYYGRDLLENGKFDYYHLLDGSMLKRLILRFGPVIGQFSQFDSGLTPIYYGWTTDSSNRTHFKSLIRDMYHKLMIHDEISLFRFTGISFVTQIPSEEEQQPITPEQPETPITPPIEEEEEEDPDDPVEDGDAWGCLSLLSLLLYVVAIAVGDFVVKKMNQEFNQCNRIAKEVKKGRLFSWVGNGETYEYKRHLMEF